MTRAFVFDSWNGRLLLRTRISYKNAHRPGLPREPSL
jgi:hypothetical protein